ncbi:hypothetical protein JZ751_004092 [Albula glossodonta]|uniref:Cadherin domain-containing protein n=1 Tax=Albula glossodonta TaxID=121402 RepID=A0A8T2PGZ5_9TELE|nr:hypothetical protein JZ751_004092 [Albula glossodonta]
MPEDPKFIPRVKAVPISEDGKSVNLKDVIVRYPAVDGDTMKDAENVRYAKGFDPDNWLVIDEETAEIRLNKVPDRESKYLVNGTYYAKILSITQGKFFLFISKILFVYMPSKTATGTIALQVEDFNDHCPELTSTSESLCTDEKVAFVTAYDKDAFPNGAPFQFTIIPEETKGEWTVERLNDTSAILRAHENLWPGPYEVTLDITDQQGHACPDRQVMKVEVCTCDKNEECITNGILSAEYKTAGAVFGGPAIGLLFLGLLTLLLVPLLLLFCNCGGGAGGIGGGFADLPYDTKEHLISYHTEGKGDDNEVPFMNAPLAMGSGFIKSQNVLQAAAAPIDTLQASASTMGGRGSFYYPPSGHVEVDYMEDMIGQEHVTGSQSAFESSDAIMTDWIALPEDYLGDYYSQKSRADAHPREESLLVYDYEGQGSLAGSVGCCSLLEADNSLEFLNDLDPKFKTLAEICKQPEPEPKVTITPPKPVTMEHSATSIHTTNTVNVTRSSPPPPQVTNTERNVIVENNYTATLPKVNVRENVVVPSQTYLVQQPMYYATAPVLQATRYVMEPQVQGMYVVGEAPVTENVVLQERRVMSGPAVHGGVIGVQQGTLNRGENVVLVERNVGPGQVVREGAPGVLQMGNLSGSQIMLVEGQVGAGQVLQGGQSWIQQGTLQRGPISGSQNIVLVERQGGAGQVVQEGMSQTQSVIHEGPMLSPGLNGGSFHMGTLPGSHKIVVKEKKIVSG